MDTSTDLQEPSLHPWKARLWVGMTMLGLSFIGLILTNTRSDGGWDFWRFIPFVYALLSLGLSVYLKRKKHSLATSKFWQEILHWAGLIAAVYLITLFVNVGVMSRLLASLSVLTLLSFSIFISGVYVEVTFIPVGLALGAFAAFVAWFEQHFYLVFLPIAALAGLSVLWLSHRKKRPSS